jgi:hypothetical protein
MALNALTLPGPARSANRFVGAMAGQDSVHAIPTRSGKRVPHDPTRRTDPVYSSE